ncbi:type II toxin-antitoxin system ParD family antitoxin [Arachidicoccus soli]|uniref:Type II toxin-antitoxin system ParD family antitoxin n=2 Tax=Arachidicoccus soli TaxID=2341117 RepID=A0A386HUA1_9BACT|nr:type II toxin-antitoxin system ParD family antitoxin [Arachidicoccus soli]
MARNTSVLLSEHFETLIDKEVSSGRYNSASEVVRDALRLFELEKEKIKYLRKELEMGEKRGIRKKFNPQKNLESLHKKYVK